MTAPIKMRRVIDIDGGKPGDFSIEPPNEWNKGEIEFICPKGRVCGVGIRRGEFEGGSPHPQGGTARKRWCFNGNVDKPTLTPSINCAGSSGCGWHGHIINGEMTNS
jgi:hypothetical protein